MNRLSQIWNLAVLFPILLCLGAEADSDTDQKWQNIRDHQPPGLQLKLTLPKDHFFQGEEINGTVEITNTSQAPYYLWTGSASQFGRVFDIVFYAEGPSGQAVPDPLAWMWSKMGDMGGMGTFKDLGTWSITLPTSYWLRFDQPGTYTLYAWSDRAQTGSQPKPNVPGGSSARIPLVSDKITITIDPLTPGQEQQTLAEAKAKLARNADRGEGALELNALQTPAARAALRPLLSDDHDGSGAFNAASMGLMEAPDPHAEAVALLAEVSQGKVAVSNTMQWVYSWTKTYGLPDGSSVVPYTQQSQAMQNELAAQRQAFGQALQTARQEIMDAAQKATGGSGPAYVETLWTAFMGNRLDPQARAAVVAHQLELSPERQDTVLRDWFFELRESHRVPFPGSDASPAGFPPPGIPQMGGEDFLPLVRQVLTQYQHSAESRGGQPSTPMTREERRARYQEQQLADFALIILANVRPDEARPLLVENIEGDDSLFFSGSFPLWGDSDTVPTLPTVPMPEVDSALRKKLAAPNPYLVPLMAVIDRYGSPDFVPDVLRVYTPEEGRRDVEVRDDFLRYLLRSDPAKGVEALAQNLQLRGANEGQGYKTLISRVLFDRWTPLAQPLLETSLNDPDSDVVVSAVITLERNGCPGCEEKAVAALERIILTPNHANSPAGHDNTRQYRNVSGSLLRSAHWKFDADQQKRLKSLASYPGSNW